MRTPVAFLKCVAKALLKYGGNAVGFGIAGDLLVEVAPEIVGDVWEYWGKDKKEAERREEIEAVAQAAANEIAEQIPSIVQEVAADQSKEVQEAVSTYLAQVPAMVRKSLRRDSDPTGTSVSANLVPQKAEDLIGFLPPKLPRFKAGDHPLQGVDWELEHLLGVGGFGEVWKARNPHFDGVPPVALKFCLDSKAKEQLLKHEAGILNQVMRQGKHPGIVQLLRSYLSADPPCLEYEYVEGGDLAGFIKDRQDGKMTVALASQVMLSLAKTVGFAHSLNPPIVHRDLKPANILIQRNKDKKIILKVADFGIGGVAATQAIQEASRGTSRGKFLASAVNGAYTPLYASPQQMRGEPADPRDDVFSMGVIWYQMLTGNLLMGRPGGRRWREKLGEVPSDLLDLLETCFEDDPDDRPVNAAAMAGSLAETLKEKPQAAAPVAKSPTVPAAPKQEPAPQRKLHTPKPGDIFTNSLGMKFAWIPPGTFLMGSPGSEEGREPYQGADEFQHKVTLTKGFYMGIHQVTRGQFATFVQKTRFKTQADTEGGAHLWTGKEWKLDPAANWRNPGFEQTNDHPLTCVSWNDALAFTEWLAQQDKKPIRLPTEAEWEWACRAGTTTPFHFGETISTDQANYDGNYTYGKGKKGKFRQKTTPVGSFPANAWGLFDMHGNVWEWCQDWFGEYPRNDVVDPQGAESGQYRVLRGGCWSDSPDYCRSACRSRLDPGRRNYDFGLRVCFCLD